VNRRKFFALSGSAFIIGGATYYGFSDKNSYVRADEKNYTKIKFPFRPDEKEILSLASLAPSGHNTQPWFIKYAEPYHWIICNDKTKWLPAVDPAQRETILSIGAFLQNIEYAANSFGYNCDVDMLAKNNQDENVVSIKLSKVYNASKYDKAKIKQRRTVRSNYLNAVLKKEDSKFLTENESDFIGYHPNTSKEHIWLNEQTIEANKIQTIRNAAQNELADWTRFSNRDAEKYRDGLTPASMEIEGLSGWIVRNFYKKENVTKKSFREQSIDKVVKQVSQSAGWFIITSKDNTTGDLLETGKRMQRLSLKVKEKNIAIHPMTQIIEEAKTNKILNTSIGINEPVQFILRTGYLKNYPNPVSLRRSVESFIQTNY
jgi:hypothetical protein